jgi:chromate transporter
VLITIFATPLLLRYRKDPRVAGFVRGVSVTVVGVLVGTTVLVGRQAIGDWLTGAIALASLAVIVFLERIPEPVVIALGGVIGLAAYQAMHPAWLLK